jgi:hypothetical protein
MRSPGGRLCVWIDETIDFGGADGEDAIVPVLSMPYRLRR